MFTNFTNNEELLNNDISEIASINRMYYICYLICVAFVDIIGFHVYWVVDKEWNVIDPLFYFLSTLVPALVCYWLYVARKDYMRYREVINACAILFYAFALIAGKNYLYGLFLLPLLIASIAYADTKYSSNFGVIVLILNVAGMVINYLRFSDLDDAKSRLYVFFVLAMSVAFIIISSESVSKRQARKIAEINKEKDRFKAIVSVGAVTIFEYDIDNDILMIAAGSDGEYGEESYIADFKNVVKRDRIIAFSDWYKFDEVVQEIIGGASVLEKELRFARDGKDYRWYRMKLRVNYNENGRYEKVIGSLEDIQDEKMLEIRKADEKMRDPLTRFYLKSFVEQKVDDYLRAEEIENYAGFFIIDIDEYDDLSEALGIAFAEETLKNIAEDITKLFYNTDIFGRTGNSEFVVLMKNVENRKSIEHKVKEIQKVIADTYIGEGIGTKCTVSIGVSVFPNDGEEYGTLFMNAEKALSLALSKGKNHYDIYNPMKENAYSVLTADSALRDMKRQSELGMSAHSIESLAELAFKLIDESKDTDSAINLLIRQVVRQMDLDAVVIKEKHQEDDTMYVMYQYGMDEDSIYATNSAVVYTPEQWKLMVDSYRYSSGVRTVDNLQEADGDEERHFMLAMGIESFVSCAYYDKGEFMGTMDFLDFQNERQWNETDVNTFKSMTNVVSSYLLKMKAYETASETVERLTGYDGVTGVYKYEKFLDLISEFIETAEHDNYAIVYTDISNFKYLNESYGYEKGDILLKQIADFINDSQYSIFTSRVFSDNIVALLRVGDIEENKFRGILMNGIKRFADTMQKEYFDSRLDMRVGVCTFTISGAPVPIKDIISNANMARKRAKLPGMPKCIFYDAQMGADAKNEIAYTNDMEVAFENREFVVFMQPKVDLVSGKIKGAEALVRWKKTDGNIIYPNDFIPIFEKNKSITQLDFYVYEEVFKYIRERLDNNLPVVPISVNVSRIHLYAIDDIIDCIKGLLARYNVPANLLEFELTETSFTDKVSDTITLMTRLRKLGVKVSLDDFGAGYSSLNVLTKLPLDVLKLDKEFMRDFDTDSEEKIVIPSVIDMAKKLKLEVVCEGVETKEQVDFLKSVGCDMVQGYYYSKPISQSAFNEMLEKGISRS